jgi:hypothetical protein
MPLDSFHPAVANWFRRTFASPTPAQVEAWPAIRSGRSTLIAAPTGSGKTLAAFLAAIDDLVRRGVSSRPSRVGSSPAQANNVRTAASAWSLVGFSGVSLIGSGSLWGRAS